MSTCSPALSGNPAALMIMSPRLDSPLPAADSSIWFWPTLPPITVARTTNAIQPRIAIFRCCALHLPTRAAMFRDCMRAPWEGWRGIAGSIAPAGTPSYAGCWRAPVGVREVTRGGARTREGGKSPGSVKRVRCSPPVAPASRARPAETAGRAANSARVLDRVLGVEVAVAVDRRPAGADPVADRPDDQPARGRAGREDHPRAHRLAGRIQDALPERIGRVAVHRQPVCGDRLVAVDAERDAAAAGQRTGRERD